MTPLPILDLIAGLIFIYFLLAIINNSLIEIIAALSKWRAYSLKKWLTTILLNKIGSQETINTFVNHPTLAALSNENKSTAYIAAKDFSTVLIDLVCKEQDMQPNTLASIKNAMEKSNILPEELKRTFLYFITKTKACKAADKSLLEIEHFEKQIENWFDGMMERLSGRFKRYTLKLTFILAFFVTVILNVDSISLANYLYSNPEARKNLATAAYNSVNDSTTIELAKKVQADYKRRDEDTRKEKKGIPQTDSISKEDSTINKLVLEVKSQKAFIDSTVGALNSYIPIGWTDAECKVFCNNPVKKIGGFIITILAMCLGAPFWFEVLGKIANLRSTVKPGGLPAKRK